MTRDDAERLVAEFMPGWKRRQNQRFYKDLQRVFDRIAERASEGAETVIVGAIEHPYRMGKFLRGLGFETVDSTHRGIGVMWWARKKAV